MGSYRSVIKLRKRKRVIKKADKKHKLQKGNPHQRGVCQKVLKQNPRKPDSGTRSVCILRQSNKRRVRAFIPGEGHNLQEHGVVLVQGAKRKNLPGVSLKVIRGKFDIASVKGRTSSRSKYGTTKKDE